MATPPATVTGFHAGSCSTRVNAPGVPARRAARGVAAAVSTGSASRRAGWTHTVSGHSRHTCSARTGTTVPPEPRRSSVATAVAASAASSGRTSQSRRVTRST